MSDQAEKGAGPQCYLVTLEVDYEQPEIIKGFGCPDAAEAFRTELGAYQRAKPAWPDNGAPPDEWVRVEKAREDWLDAHPAGRGASGADRFGIIIAPFVPPAPEQEKHTYLVGYSHSSGAGRSFETFNGTPTPKDIVAMENGIEARTGIASVSITSISRIGNSNE